MRHGLLTYCATRIMTKVAVKARLVVEICKREANKRLLPRVMVGLVV